MTFPVSVLFARRDSHYKQIADCDVYDVDRDARTWPGGTPCVAHPPCRAWGRLRHFAKPRADEMDLARFAVSAVRANGGVLEHPAMSLLWTDQGLPQPGRVDALGGWTLLVPQHWWGHRAEKATWLYIVGTRPEQMPDIPLRLGSPTHVIAQMKTRSDGTRVVKGCPGWRPEVSKRERELTPPAFAQWLVHVAQRSCVLGTEVECAA